MQLSGLEIGIYIILVTICGLDMIEVFRRDLMMLQQNSYRNERYVRWFNHSGESTTPWRLGACISLFLVMVNHLPHLLTAILASIILLCNFIAYLRKKYKKPLVFTKRALRIYVVSLLLAFSLPVSLGICLHSLVLASKIGILVIILSPIFMLFSNVLLNPIEKTINRKYYNEAKEKLKDNVDLRIIGITGSYGKTSTKHFLQHILSQKYETLMTPGSYNTLLGVIRTIRESLKPYTKIFIVEMGAKQSGDIREICNLVNPEIGIVTSIGEQHLESFKTMENIVKTKFELLNSLPSDGLGVVNVNNEIVNQHFPNNCKIIKYPSKTGYSLENVIYKSNGSEMTISAHDGWSLQLSTPLMGRGNLENLMAAVIVARYLNVPDTSIKYAASTMPQVEHRLSLKHTAAGFTILDDAFNSNPAGASMALEVLQTIDVEGKKIIITPGMIELGELQEESNHDFGLNIARSADLAIIVGDYNRQAIVSGLEEGGMKREQIITVSDFNQAQKHLLIHVGKGDVVLYENDLPDTFK